MIRKYDRTRTERLLSAKGPGVAHSFLFRIGNRCSAAQQADERACRHAEDVFACIEKAFAGFGQWVWLCRSPNHTRNVATHKTALIHKSKENMGLIVMVAWPAALAMSIPFAFSDDSGRWSRR
jgi:hypothetical protein